MGNGRHVMFSHIGAPAGRGGGRGEAGLTSGHIVHAVALRTPCLTSAMATTTSPVSESVIGCWSKSLDLVSPVSTGPSTALSPASGGGGDNARGLTGHRAGAIYRAFNVYTKP